jgi:hypothetical protein
MYIPWWVFLIVASLLLYALYRFGNLEKRVEKLESSVGEADREEDELYEA